MNRLASYLIYVLSLIFLLSFSVVFLTENTNIISKLYKNNIIDIIKKKSSLNYNFEELSMKWNGLNPSLIFENISLYDKASDQHYLDSEKLILEIDSLGSISRLSLVPKEINLVKSNIDLRYDKKGIFIRNHNLSENKGDNDAIDNIRFRVTDSSINIDDNINSTRYELKNINMVIFKKNKDIKLFTTFTHNSVGEIIHLASDFTFINNNINGKIYSQGVNINLEKGINFIKNIDISANKVNYIFWADILNNRITDVKGNFNILKTKLLNKITKSSVILDNFSSNIFYNNKEDIDNISLNKFSFKTRNNNYNDNQLILSMNEKVLSDLSLDRLYISDFKKILNLLTIDTQRVVKRSLSVFESGLLSNIILRNLDDKKSLKYKLSFDKTFLRNKSLQASNIAGKIEGNSQLGYIKLSSSNVGIRYDNDKFDLSRLNGDIYLKYVNNEFLVSSNNILIDNNHNIQVSGSFSPQRSNYKIDLTGKINHLLSELPSSLGFKDIMQETKINSNYAIDYRFHETNNKTYAYGAVSLSDLVLKNNLKDITLNTNKIRINFFDKYYQSYPSKIYLNNNEFLTSIDTNISSGIPRYIAYSRGTLSDRFIKSFINHKLINSFRGEAKADLQLVYEPSNKKFYIKVKSNLKGLELDILPPLKKSSKENKEFELSYMIQENQRNTLDMIYDIYKIQLSMIKDSLYAVVDSPYIVGTLVLPEKITTENRLTARLKYFDLNKFQGNANPAKYPPLDMDMKSVKINKTLFQDFKIRTSPLKNGMIIESLGFSKNTLIMTGNGKWLNTEDGQITLFDSKFTSDDFGQSLNSLGYKNIIKEGLLSSRLIGQWNGSPDYFSLNNFDGKITVDLKDGEFLQVSKQSKAIGQLLGLFSISSLQKRLSLDFSDFFSSGLSFDNMNGEFVFSNSQAKAKDLVLKGSFGEMRVNGSSDLNNKTHDQKLIYIPDLSSMSLISGTLLGGPVGALASIFYDRVLEQIGIDTNQLAAVEYSIQGSWENPEIKVIEPFKPITN